MEGLLQRILVVGGNGFVGMCFATLHLLANMLLGSAVCKAALAKGYQVTSIRSIASHPDMAARIDIISVRLEDRTELRKDIPRHGHLKCCIFIPPAFASD